MNARLAVVSLTAALAALTLMPAAADNTCKGQSQQACDSTAGCTWVKGYARKDGREVAPYCRVKAMPKPAAQTTSQPLPAAG